jgi:hypothetical protein
MCEVILSGLAWIRFEQPLVRKKQFRLGEKTQKLINLKLFFKIILCKIIEIFVKNNLVVHKKYDRTPFVFWYVKTKLNGYFIS